MLFSSRSDNLSLARPFKARDHDVVEVFVSLATVESGFRRRWCDRNRGQTRDLCDSDWRTSEKVEAADLELDKSQA